jgi:hypothetical protein
VAAQFRRISVFSVRRNQHRFAAMIEPRHVLELARLLEESGDRAAARREYQLFLDFWNNADAGLPEVAEARRGVQRLR